MSRETFFTDVALSYKELLSTPLGESLSLRDYCRSRHAAYRDFIKWASTNEAGSGLSDIDKIRKKAAGVTSRKSKVN